MNKLGFFKPVVNNENTHLSALANFDGYFALSGNRYKIIKECDLINNKKCYEVEGFYKKPSYLLNTLKVASYLTVIIPLIMLVGKAIARHKYHFCTEAFSIPPKHVKINIPNSKQNVSVINQNIVSEQMKLDLDNFRQNALTAFQAKNISSKNISLNFNEEQRKDLVSAYQNRFYPEEQGFVGKRLRGGINFVFFLDSIPGLVFKPMAKLDAERYIAIVKQAQDIVKDKGLYLLKPPASEVVEVDGIFFVCQEKMDLMHGAYRFQKGLYEHCWKDPQLRPYMNELFSQLLTFICEMKFSDVKYDNIPLTTTGNIGLIDIDNYNRDTGLFHGGSNHHDGFFHYLPVDAMNQFAQQARTHLGDIFNEDSFADAVQRSEKKQKKNEMHLQLIKKNHSKNSEIDLKVLKKFKAEDHEEVALVINEINKQLWEQKNNLSPTEARRVCLFTRNMPKTNLNEMERLNKWNEVIFPTLKKEDCLSRYRVDKNYYFSIVHC
jgi:hypothetical protein